MNSRITKAISASVILLASLLIPLDHAAAVVCTSSKSTFVGNGTIGSLNAVYTVESFTTVVAGCTWAVPSNVTKVDALIIGGGGGGGTWVAGGGGAGGMMDTTSISVTPNANISITVGSGGSGATRSVLSSISSTAATNGGASSFGTYSVDGGGYGGSWSDAAGQNGGSGGGGTGSTAQGNTTNSLYGNNGGTGNSDGAYSYPSGGGGGAGGVGLNGQSNISGLGKSGDGGPGRASTITGTSVIYAGGGGAGCHGNTTPSCVVGQGGSGGGGTGDMWISSTHQTSRGGNGLDNSGSGGGGGGGPNSTAFNPSYYYGGNGGSGVVVIRYISDLKLNSSLGTGSITSTSTTYRTSTQMNVNAPVNGKVTFLQFGKRIPGCQNLTATSGATVTCNWKPSFHGQIPITLNYYQTGLSGIFKTANFTFSTVKRANSR